MVKNIGAPVKLQNDVLSRYALLFMFVHCSHKNLESYFAPPSKVLRVMESLKLVFSKVFRENSVSIRLTFFRNELVKYLWLAFSRDESDFFLTFFEQLRASPRTSEQIYVLIEDIAAIEQRVDYNILDPAILQRQMGHTPTTTRQTLPNRQ